ncbi:hypothetical protein ACFLU3_00725 [Chloroflexota bacterium]
MSNTTIHHVKEAVDVNLPDCWLPLEACLSVVGAAMLEDVDHCIGLILVGVPGGRKSTTLELLGNSDPMMRINDFTPASFVTHVASKRAAQLQHIDLLPKIKHKVMIIPELAPMFGKRHEDLIKEIAILTAVMDGKGYISSGGTHGLRGYEGDFRFNMIGATTPLERRVWQALGKLSSRWILYSLETASTEFKSLSEDFTLNKSMCQMMVDMFMDGFWQGYGVVKWNRTRDDEEMGKMLASSAVSISAWRGLVVKQDQTGYNPPIIEAPDRLRETLYAIARGHALLYGRTQLDWEDVKFATYLNETNMPEDRLRVFRWIKEQQNDCMLRGGKPDGQYATSINAYGAADAIGCGTTKAEGVLNELAALGVLKQDDLFRYRRVI